MRVVVALCSVKYSGRGDTTLDAAVRAIVVKNDGAVSIHNDKSNKPLNYMGAGCSFTEIVSENDSETLWFFDTRKESLTITLYSVLSDVNLELDPGEIGLVRDGTESQLQEWLSEHPETFGEGWKFIEREFKTGVGGLDLLMEDPDGNPVAVEVKRTATPNSVYQVIRYVDAMKETKGFENVYGLVAEVDLRPNMITLAEKKQIITVAVPPFWRDQR